MSNTRKTNKPAPTNPVLAALAGHTVPGGCDHCNAEQRFADEGGGVYRTTIAHDPDCPFLARRRAGAR